jgi:hypothetical protein
MFGYPSETVTDIQQTYRLVEKADPDDVACAVTKAQIGTPLYDLALEQKVVSDDLWMSDDREYFTFLNQEQLEFALGCEMLFYERFTKHPVRGGCEKNGDLVALADDPTRRQELRDRTARLLGV